MKKYLLFFTVFLLALFVLTACGTSEESSKSDDMDDRNDSETVLINDLGLKLEAEQNENRISIKLKLTNESDEDKELEFSSGQQFDIWVKDNEGTTVYHYGEGMMFTQALIYETIAPGETLEFEDVWESDDLTSLDEVFIEGEILVTAIDGERLEEEFKQEQAVQID